MEGGTGWWRFKFCYGKAVHQYHDHSAAGQAKSERSGRESILIGEWNKQEHKRWIAKGNQPIIYATTASGKKRVYGFQQLYTNGATCEATGKPRVVVVRMKCRPDVKNPNAVVIYLREPSTCSYILSVESDLVCQMTNKVDENGVLIGGL